MIRDLTPAELEGARGGQVPQTEVHARRCFAQTCQSERAQGYSQACDELAAMFNALGWPDAESLAKQTSIAGPGPKRGIA